MSQGRGHLRNLEKGVCPAMQQKGLWFHHYWLDQTDVPQDPASCSNTHGARGAREVSGVRERQELSGKTTEHHLAWSLDNLVWM